MGSVNQFLHQKVFLSLGTFWSSVSTYLLPLFGFIISHLFRRRFKRKDYSEIREKGKKDSIFIEADEELKTVTKPEAKEKPPKQDFKEFSDSENDGFGQKETPEFCFQFKFPTYEEFKSRGGDIDSVSSKQSLTTVDDRYGFLSEKGLSSFIEEPEVLSFSAKDSNFDSNDVTSESKSISDQKISGQSEKGLSSFIDEPEVLSFSAKDSNFDSNDVTSESKTVCDQEFKEQSQKNSFTENEEQLVGDQEVSDEVQFHSEKDSFDLGSDSDSMSSTHLGSVVNRLIDSYSDGFLSDRDFETEFELNGSLDIDGTNIDLHEEMSDFSDENNEDSDILEELRKLGEAEVKKLENSHSENFLSETDFEEDMKNSKNEQEFPGEDENSGDPNSKKLSEWDSEDSNELESLWEHQEMIEQLKMELKKVRATGLPTILEDSESPKIMEDLKPWRIDEKFHKHEDPMDELHKFYKSYRERMRKFDILNYQKMYAIGFLQLKDPLQSISTQKSSAPTLTSLLSQNFTLYKHKKSETDPMKKFIKELESELEVVYVGQMCLSWEFLHWQYGKSLELWESDPRGIRVYNEVAGEFQQFQVLMQRFIEDGPFQGPRVPNFVKNRCIYRNLLQVPVIREDNSKDRKKARRRENGDYVITSDILVEIIEESIRLFWRFVRADESFTNVIIKGRHRSQLELLNPADSELLMEVRTCLQKKERKLKDLLRSGKCILKRFRTCQEDDTDHVLCFFSQVDMKLVSRVLKMSTITTDQLVWCRDKLNKISFVNRNISVEPSILLFPC